MAVGMSISTLVLALTGGGGKCARPGTISQAIRQGQFGHALANLLGKAAAALPGIIGFIVSWLLNTLEKTATWLAENLWAMAIAVGTLLLVAARGLANAPTTKAPLG